jgi:hypothetical protein
MNTPYELIQQLVNELQGYRVAHPEHDMPALDAARGFLSSYQSYPKDIQDASERVRHFLSEYGKIRGLDPDVVHALNTGDEVREAHLTVADLDTIVSALYEHS